jgi:NAD(P)-dependent dehydrogenase (short-subunit alcohol dehydrogenase family)
LPTSKPYAGAVAAIHAARERFGRIDLLVNNVGGTIWSMPYAEYAEAQIEAEIRRSLFPTLWEAAAILFLASDDASYITGVTLPVAGGDLG